MAVASSICGLLFLSFLTEEGSAEAQLGSSSCWTDGIREEDCCGENWGPTGNVMCWDGGHFTVENCCSAATKAVAEPAPVFISRGEEDAEGVMLELRDRESGIFIHYEPGKDCWTGSTYSRASCCDLNLGKFGNQACWNGWRYSFERCCIAGEAAPGDSRKPQLAEPLGAALQPPRDLAMHNANQLLHAIPVGQECWKDGFTWFSCCPDQPSMQCWDGTYTKHSCCDGWAEPPQVWQQVRLDDPQVVCLAASRYRGFDLDLRPLQCQNGRFFYLAATGERKMGLDLVGLPWWLYARTAESQAEAYIELYKPIRPYRHRFVGGICVPFSCTLEITAAYLAARVVPWWRYPRLEPMVLNQSHALLPPPIARRQKIFPTQVIADLWVATRPPERPDEKPRSWEFTIVEHRRHLDLTEKQVSAVLSVAVMAVSVSFLPPKEGRSKNFLLPQYHVLQLGLARGPGHFDVVRILLTLIVVFMHVLDQGPWLPTVAGSSVEWLRVVRSFMNRVNIGFVVLMVHLSMNRRSLKRSTGFRSWLWEVLVFGVRRWLAIGPLIFFWNLVYVYVPETVVPMNNVLKSHGLYTWYGEQRDTCEHPAHMLSSALLMHTAIMGTRSPCHNSDIFEGLFQVDIFVFMLVSATGKSRMGYAAVALWVPAVMSSYMITAPGPHAVFNGAGHRFCWLLPSALAAVAMSSALNFRARSSNAAGSWPKLTFVFAVTCILLPTLQDGLTMGTWVWLKSLSAFFKALHTPTREYVVPCHFYELPFVLGELILLRQPPSGHTRSSSERWSLLRFLSRNSSGICLANIFVLHLLAAFLVEEPLESTVFTVLACFLMTYASSVVVAVMVMLFFQGPCSSLLEATSPQVSALPAAAPAA